MSNDNLIELWMQVSTASGEPLAQAVRDLCDETGIVIRQNRIYEWRDGVTTPPPVVLQQMARDVAQTAVYRALGEPPGTYSDDRLHRLAAMMSPPRRLKKNENQA